MYDCVFLSVCVFVYIIIMFMWIIVMDLFSFCVAQAYSFASNSSIPFNSSLIANGELFEDVSRCC